MRNNGENTFNLVANVSIARSRKGLSAILDVDILSDMRSQVSSYAKKKVPPPPFQLNYTVCASYNEPNFNKNERFQSFDT